MSGFLIGFAAYLAAVAVVVFALHLLKKRGGADESLHHSLRSPHPRAGWRCTCALCNPARALVKPGRVEYRILFTDSADESTKPKEEDR